MKNFYNLFFASLLILFSVIGYAQDTLVMSDNTVLTGEIKKLERGVISIETDYSDDDLTIEWKKVKSVKSGTIFLITLSDGKRINGTLESKGTNAISIIPMESNENVINSNLKDIVYLKSVERNFVDRLSASVDVGFDLAKANDMRKFSVRMALGYIAPRWGADADFSTLFSNQEGAEDIRRYSGGLGFKYFLRSRWYLPASVSSLSNTEQSIKLRTVGKVGGGLYLIQTNSLYWGVELGVSYNNETYFSTDPARHSVESYAGTEFNIFDFEDLSLLAKTSVFYDLSEKNHWRSDVSLDFKYDLPYDLYVSLAFSLNYDSKPVSGSPNSDYVFHTGFGWSW